ncbi:DNA-protecting protein DprA [bacterium]|nr:DNA-protecting protein DprA [bacterium]
MTADELAPWIALQAVSGMGAASLTRLVQRFGSPDVTLHATPEELALVPRVTRQVLGGIPQQAERLPEHRELASRLLDSGVSPLLRTDSAYPTRLHALVNPPPLLYVRGALPKDNVRTFGIVGTTKPSERGAEVARAAARHLASAGWVIVSGHARGIDAMAHRGALEARRHTMLVLPTGILTFRPRPGYPEAEEFWRRAAVLSEWHPEAAWRTPAALARNRVIAALSDCLLVVETRGQGGTMNTFKHASALGRRTFVVHYRTPSLSAAGNPTVRDSGATPVRSLRHLDQLLAQPTDRASRGERPW